MASLRFPLSWVRFRGRGESYTNGLWSCRGEATAWWREGEHFRMSGV